jgi:hypothetical protein
MPAQALWIERLPDILQQVSVPDAPAWWDRVAIQTLFGLKRSRAVWLMRQIGAREMGAALVVDRAALERFLRNPEHRDVYQAEQFRSGRVARALGEARRDLGRRAIVIPAAADAERVDFAGLPPGIQLQRHQLTISFDAPTELLEKLFALSQALLHDYETFEEALSH